MSACRRVNSRIWRDGWFLRLPTRQKLLFFYLFSNQHANLSGLYELPLPVIVSESGLAEDQVREGLAALEHAGKVIHADGWVWVVDLEPFGTNLNNSKIRKHLRSTLEAVPDTPLKERWLARYGSLLDRDDGGPGNGADTARLPNRGKRTPEGGRALALTGRSQAHERANPGPASSGRGQSAAGTPRSDSRADSRPSSGQPKAKARASGADLVSTAGPAAAVWFPSPAYAVFDLDQECGAFSLSLECLALSNGPVDVAASYGLLDLIFSSRPELAWLGAGREEMVVFTYSDAACLPSPEPSRWVLIPGPENALWIPIPTDQVSKPNQPDLVCVPYPADTAWIAGSRDLTGEADDLSMPDPLQKEHEPDPEPDPDPYHEQGFLLEDQIHPVEGATESAGADAPGPPADGYARAELPPGPVRSASCCARHRTNAPPDTVSVPYPQEQEQESEHDPEQGTTESAGADAPGPPAGGSARAELPPGPVRSASCCARHRTNAPPDTVSVPYPQEQEQESEHDPEQGTTESAGADRAASPTGGAADLGSGQRPALRSRRTPFSFSGWETALRQSTNRPATLLWMFKTLYPDRDPPSYGYLGVAGRRVGGARRLAELLWWHAARPPTGDVLAYVQAAARREREERRTGEPAGFAGIRMWMEGEGCELPGLEALLPRAP